LVNQNYQKQLTSAYRWFDSVALDQAIEQRWAASPVRTTLVKLAFLLASYRSIEREWPSNVPFLPLTFRKRDTQDRASPTAAM
jgi:hypothetical protein